MPLFSFFVSIILRVLPKGGDLDSGWSCPWLSGSSLRRWCAASEGDGCDDKGDEEAGKGEPGEGATRLQESALVGGTVEERLAVVGLVAAGVDSETGGEGDSTGEGEEHHDSVDR